MKIGNFETKAANDVSQDRLSFLIWGMSGCGKTTLACTLPGRKLLVSLDPDGAASVSYRDDVDVLDLSGHSTEAVLRQIQNSENPLGLHKILEEGNYDSVILDSLTSLSQRALEKAVRDGHGKSGRFIPSMEIPGLAAYGARNAVILEVCKGFLRVTGRHNTHLAFISHEDEPKTNTAGDILYITMMLGGKSVSNISLQLSEVWWMRQDKDKQVIAIRPVRQRKPMKTRIFSSSGAAEFPLKYDPESEDPLATWIAEWKKEGKKLPLPT